MATSRLKQVIAVIGVVVPLVGTIGAIWLLWQRLVDWNDRYPRRDVLFHLRDADV